MRAQVYAATAVPCSRREELHAARAAGRLFQGWHAPVGHASSVAVARARPLGREANVVEELRLDGRSLEAMAGLPCNVEVDLAARMMLLKHCRQAKVRRRYSSWPWGELARRPTSSSSCWLTSPTPAARSSMELQHGGRGQTRGRRRRRRGRMERLRRARSKTSKLGEVALVASVGSFMRF